MVTCRNCYTTYETAIDTLIFFIIIIALESKQVSVKTRKPDSDFIKHITCPLHCTIWSTCDSQVTMERKGVHQPLQVCKYICVIETQYI